MDFDNTEQSYSEVYELRTLLEKLCYEKENRNKVLWSRINNNKYVRILRLALEMNKNFLEDDLRNFSLERVRDYPQDPFFLRWKRALDLSSQNERNRQQPSISAEASSSSSTPVDTTSSAASSSIQPMPWPVKSKSTLMSEGAGSDYDVFLSFRGEDTRKGFTDHLYRALENAGVRTFRDNEELRVGEEISTELVEAINQSKFGIPIISRGYVSSKWCLLELAYMSSRNRTKNLKIFPVFYDVTPADVKLQTETFKNAFLQHEANVKLEKETVEEWKAALQKLKAIKGWEKEKIANGHEADLVEKIVKYVREELKTHTMEQPEHLVGMRHHFEALTELLDCDSDNEVRIVVIHGMGGIGKTTIAKVMYNNLLCESFQPCRFIEDIREKASKKTDRGLIDLQEFLIFGRPNTSEIATPNEGINTIKRRFNGKKALVVLDDVDQQFQLDFLVGKKEWFGGGSRIIITTRNIELFKKKGIYLIYEPGEMNAAKSLKLFSKHAFGSNAPPEHFYKLSTEIVSTGGGLPLFLEVIGNYLYDEEDGIWKETLEKLKKCQLEEDPYRRVQEKLRISYDALGDSEEKIFLDVACHFIGTSKKTACYMWHDLGLYKETVIKKLCRLALLKVDDQGLLRMHDLLRDLGRGIVRLENEVDPSKRSRLWSHEDVREVLMNKTGTSKTETLSVVNSNAIMHETYPCDAFKKLTELRYLRMERASLDGDFQGPLSNLRWLRLKRFDSNIRFSHFRPQNLVILDLSFSKISDDGELPSLKMASKLKILKLSGCRNLKRSPDFSTFRKLEKLDLSDCPHLVEIDPSIGLLESLSYFSIARCESFKVLPKEIGKLKNLEEVDLGETAGISNIFMFGEDLKKLETFRAPKCRSLIQVPPSIGRLCSLSDLNLHGTGIRELPDSISSLTTLRRLSLFDCKSLVKLPGSIGFLLSLEDLDLFGCSLLNALPQTIGNLKNLRKLSIFCTGIKILPDDVRKLKNLEKFIPWDFSFSTRELPDWIWELSSLRMLKLDEHKISYMPKEISSFSKLTTLDLRRCSNVSLPKELKLPQCLTKLHIPFNKVSLDAVVDLRNLKRLGFNHSAFAERVQLKDPKDLSMLWKLEKLTFFGVKKIYSLQNIIKLDSLPRLKEFEVILCTNLQSLPDMPTSLRSLCLEKCGSISRLPNLSKLKKLSRLQVYNCDRMTELPGLGGAERLTLLNTVDCGKLSNLEGLQHLKHLEELRTVRCNSLESLPDLSDLEKLKTLCVRDIPELTKILGLQALSRLEDLNLSDCTSLKGVLRLPDRQKLRRLQIHACKKVAKIQGLEVDTLEYYRDQEGLVFYHGKPSGEVEEFDLIKYKRSEGHVCAKHTPESSEYEKEDLARKVSLWVEKEEDKILDEEPLRQSTPTEQPREESDSDEEPLAVEQYNSDEDDFVV